MAALTFFLCLTGNTSAQFNIADGDVYGNSNTVLTATTITSIKNGTSNLDVGYSLTDTINLNHAINGYISISNGFNGFDINSLSSAASLTASNSAALSAFNGTNLSITGGSFTGGVAPAASNDWTVGIGGVISNVHNVRISDATFTGVTVEIFDPATVIPPTPGITNNPGLQTPIAVGADAMVLIDSTDITFFDDPTLQGGSGGTADSTSFDADARGGMGLAIIGSSAVISNGIYAGGNGGTASSSGNNQAFANGGSGLFASNSVVDIHGGTFNGGLAGTENGSSAFGGAGLVANGASSITVSNGIFTGASGSASAIIANSSLTTYGGTFTSGGLSSLTMGANTNKIILMGGTFSSLFFGNTSSNGVQHLSTGSNLTVVVDVVQDGGTVLIDNQDNSGLQQITIRDGSMVFSNDYTLISSGVFGLDGNTSMAIFQQRLDVDGEFDIGLGQVAVTSNLNVNSGSTLNFQVLSTNEWGQITAGSASFLSNSTIVVDASLAGFSQGSVTNALLTTGSPITGTNNIIADVQTTLNTNVSGRTTFGGMLADNNLSFIFNTASLSNYWGATGELAVLADELDEINNNTMNTLINNLGSAASKAAAEETYFTTLNSMQTALHGLNAALGQSFSRGTEFRETLNLPQGAKGPEEQENDWRFWMKYYGQFYSHSKTKEITAYDTSLHGGVLGMDKSYGSLLVGISGGMGNYRTESDNDSEESANAAHAAIYSTLGKGHSYLDAGIAYGYNNVESETGGPFVLEGDFDTQLISGYIGGGVGFELPNIGTVVTPEASIQYSTYQQDAYTETSTTAVPRSFDEFDADSLRSSLGLNVAMLNTKALETFGFKIEGRFHWMREFNAEPGDLDFQLVGGSYNYQIAAPALDEDIYRIGIGISCFNTIKNKPKNVMLRLDFDELFGEDFNSHNLAAKAIFAF